MKPIGYCRVCGSTDLTFLFSLGEQYVNNFVDPGKEHDGIRYPIELELCRNCSLVQLRHTAPQEILYSRHYWYRSGVTQTMRDALYNVFMSAMKLATPHPGDVALDIGSNDGTLLRNYPKWMTTVGVEPADNLFEEGQRNVDVLIHDFWDAADYHGLVEKKAKIITALGMFYDLDDPNAFIRDVADCLEPNGVFIAQLMCLRNMIDQGDVGNLAHEHLEFYSLRSLDRLLNAHGLEIMDIQHNYINGGSYRLYCRHIGSALQPFKHAEHRLANLRAMESGLDDPDFYVRFFYRLERNKRECVEFIRNAVAHGKRVWVYGASTKGNVILQYYGLDKTLIEGAAERSPEKWGKVTIGTGIPITSEEAARAARPDYFLVLPYAFIKEFVAREAAWQEQGGRFIVPLPEFTVL